MFDHRKRVFVRLKDAVTDKRFISNPKAAVQKNFDRTGRKVYKYESRS